MRTLRGVACALIAAVCLSCMPAASPISGEARTVGPVTVTLRVDPATVQVGEQVRFSVTLFNVSGRPEEITFPTQQLYDFRVLTEDETTEVWRWSADRVFAQAVTEMTLDGQMSRPFVEHWRPEEPGSYVVKGLVAATRFDRELTGELTVVP